MVYDAHAGRDGKRLQGIDGWLRGVRHGGGCAHTEEGGSGLLTVLDIGCQCGVHGIEEEGKMVMKMEGGKMKVGVMMAA